MKFIIQGGKKLEGVITLAGAKNAANKMMIASLLTEEPCVLENFPRIGETEIVSELCRSVGSRLDLQGSTLTIATPTIINCRVLSLSRRNRIPILALGPLLARSGEAEVPFLGGDQVGPRPVDLHLLALRALGAEIEVGVASYKAIVRNGFHGASISFRYPSVGATENALLSSVLAKGRTVITNAATEPEVMELIKMLQKMGAIISVGLNRVIEVEGVKKLRGVRHRIVPDRNEAVSFGCLAIATGGRVLVREAVQDHLVSFLDALRKIGGGYEIKKEGIEFFRLDSLSGLTIETDTYPGFMTDWQQPFAVLLTQAEGISRIHETVYEDRFGYTNDLNLMGADITVSVKCLGGLPCRFSNGHYLHSAEIKGPRVLRGTNLKVRDLRSGIAHLIAAFSARGESVIQGVEEIDRGYERIDERLRVLGAEIARLP